MREGSSEDASEDGPTSAPLSADVRRRLDAIFGDVLPSVTRDELDPQPERRSSADDELLADRPPHHDREG